MADMPTTPSWLESLKFFKTTLLSALKTRFDLLCLEWQEERKRLFYIVLFSVAAFITFFFFLLTLTAAIIISFWGTDFRYWVVWGVCLFYGLSTGVLIGLILKQVCCAIPPFKTTLEELRKDCQWLSSASRN